MIDFGAAKAKRHGFVSARREWAGLAATLVIGLVTMSLFLEQGRVDAGRR